MAVDGANLKKIRNGYCCVLFDYVRATKRMWGKTGSEWVYWTTRYKGNFALLRILFLSVYLNKQGHFPYKPISHIFIWLDTVTFAPMLPADTHFSVYFFFLFHHFLLFSIRFSLCNFTSSSEVKFHTFMTNIYGTYEQMEQAAFK